MKLLTNVYVWFFNDYYCSVISSIIIINMDSVNEYFIVS